MANTIPSDSREYSKTKLKQKRSVATWCLRPYIGMRPYMEKVYIKERINDQTTIGSGGSPVTPRIQEKIYVNCCKNVDCETDTYANTQTAMIQPLLSTRRLGIPRERNTVHACTFLYVPSCTLISALSYKTIRAKINIDYRTNINAYVN